MPSHIWRIFSSVFVFENNKWPVCMLKLPSSMQLQQIQIWSNFGGSFGLPSNFNVVSFRSYLWEVQMQSTVFVRYCKKCFEEFLVRYLYLKTINDQFACLNFQVVCNCSKYKSEVILEDLLVCQVISTWLVSDHTYEKFKCNQQFLLDIVRSVLLDCSSKKILNGCHSNTWKPNLNLFCRVSIFCTGR